MLFRDRVGGIGMVQIPSSVLCNKDLQSSARILYGILGNYAREDTTCYPGIKRLARDLAIGERTVRRSIASLVEAGLVEKKRRGRGCTNLYQLGQRLMSGVIFVDRTEAAGFVQIPMLVIRDSRLQDSTKLLYGLLCRYARSDEYCFPGLERMSEDLGISVSTVQSGIESLERVGLLVSELRGLGKTNLYYLVSLREVYAKDGLITVEAKENCRIEPEEQDPVAEVRVEVPVVAAQSAEARAKEKASEARQRREEKRKEISKTTRKKPLSKPATGSRQIEKEWIAALRDKFPGAEFRSWAIKDKTLVKKMIDEVGVEIVQKTLLYVVSEWDSLLGRWRWLDGYPNIGFTFKFRDTLYAEAQRGRAKIETRDAYQHRQEHPGDGLGFG